MTTFVLVHGGHHGGWCWDALVRDLAGRGHHAVAPDLPCDDAAAGYDEYVDAVLAALRPVDDPDLVLVGHSLGAYTAALVAARRPVRHLVLLGAVPATVGTPIPSGPSSILTDEHRAVARFHDGAGRSLIAPADARRLYYDDCPEPLASWAVARLRPQGRRPLVEPWPLAEWPPVPRTVVLAADDRVVRVDAAADAARRLLGDEPVVIPGGHSPFLSRPALLADVLLALGAGRGPTRGASTGTAGS